MSVFLITVEQGHKVARAITSREEYLALRNAPMHRQNLAMARQGKEGCKRLLTQFNYSLRPTPACPSAEASSSRGKILNLSSSCEDPHREGGDSNAMPMTFPLKGCKTVGNSVGMDVDLNEEENLEEKQNHAIRDRILAKKEELGLLMLERSVTKGYHLVFKRHTNLSNEDNLRWASELIGVPYDKGAKDVTRVFFATSATDDDLIFLDDEIFLTTESTENTETAESGKQKEEKPADGGKTMEDGRWKMAESSSLAKVSETLPIMGEVPQSGGEGLYLGIKYSDIVSKWWKLYNSDQEPVKGNRDTLTYELALNLRHICGFNRELMAQVIPNYDGFPEAEKLKCIDSALEARRTKMPPKLAYLLDVIRKENVKNAEVVEAVDEVALQDELFYYNQFDPNNLPQGVKDSINSVEPTMAMAMLTAIAPAIGALTTGVNLDVHGQKNSLNLISFIAGDAASNKGKVDPVLKTWMYEIRAKDKEYQLLMDDYRKRKRAAKNSKQQPEEPKLPIRWVTLNNTVANLAEILANTEDKHAFSFTSEADTVAQKWSTGISDFSVMVRQAYDNSDYDREARSIDAVNVHIEHLRWNIVMCGTPDALHRVVKNYTDGLQTRISIGRTPDNTYAKLTKIPFRLTDEMVTHIHQVAHLLPFMEGDIELPKLEERGQQWLEEIRLEAMKDDDRTRARQRMRICVTVMRMIACYMLCAVCEKLIARYGVERSEVLLRENPDLWKELMYEMQTDFYMNLFAVIANYQLDNNLYFFRDFIEAANERKTSSDMRSQRGKNDNIFERLGNTFTTDDAMQAAMSVKGSRANRITIRVMISRWVNNGLVIREGDGRFRKCYAFSAAA